MRIFGAKVIYNVNYLQSEEKYEQDSNDLKFMDDN